MNRMTTDSIMEKACLAWERLGSTFLNEMTSLNYNNQIINDYD